VFSVIITKKAAHVLYCFDINWGCYKTIVNQFCNNPFNLWNT